MIHLIQFAFFVFALVVIFRGVVQIRAGGGGGIGPLLPGLALLGFALFGGMLLHGNILLSLLHIALWFFLIGVLLSQIGKAFGYVKSLPKFGIAFAFVDATIIGLVWPPETGAASAIWSLGVLAWLAGKIGPLVFGPLIAARKQQADLEIVKLQQAQETN